MTPSCGSCGAQFSGTPCNRCGAPDGLSASEAARWRARWERAERREVKAAKVAKKGRTPPRKMRHGRQPGKR